MGVNVEILGQSLTVSSDNDERAKALAATVGDRIKLIRAKESRAVNSVSVAIWAALEFADELERLRQDHQALIDQIEALNRQLSMTIDS